MKKNIIIIIVVVIIFVVTGFVWWKWMSSLNLKHNGPVETIRLATVKTVPELSTLIWIADEQGYFKEQGLDVKITQEINGLVAQEKVAAGAADISTGSDFGFVSESSTLNNLQILASIDQAQIIDVVARKDKGINIPADLQGKKIGLLQKSANEFFFGQFLTANNILSSQVNIINMPLADQQEAITSGKIDAVATTDPTVYNIKTALGENGIDWPAQGGQDFYWLIISNEQFLKNHPEAAVHFLKSISLAYDFLKANPEKSHQIIENKFTLSQDYFQQEWPKHKFVLALDESLITTLESETRWAIAHRSVNQVVVPNYINFIYFPAMTKIKPEAVTIIH